MISEAQRFWDAIVGKVRKVAQDESKNAFRCERYKVTTAPNGSKIGVTLPLGSKEIFLPYSSEVEEATVGSQVLVVWWGSMSNAKVYYYADGYRGCIFPIGYIYMSVDSKDPGDIFGGRWERIQDTFLLAAGTNHSAGSTGGSETVTLTANQSGQRALSISGGGHSHTITTKYRKIFQAGTNRDGYYGAGTADGSNTSMASIADNTGTHSHSVSAQNASEAHTNMPPYLTVYMWKRTA